VSPATKSAVNQERNAFASAVPATAGEFFENPSENASTIFSFSTFFMTKVIRMSLSPGSFSSSSVETDFFSV